MFELGESSSHDRYAVFCQPSPPRARDNPRHPLPNEVGEFGSLPVCCGAADFADPTGAELNPGLFILSGHRFCLMGE